ncbi:hypothetical protein FACS1894216_20850 [Synergistales bacterium]|nr:hypothetical protein FACS1894216_20850 [Synergistales bacterium]
MCSFDYVGLFFEAHRFLSLSLILFGILSLCFFVKSLLPDITAKKALAVSLFFQTALMSSLPWVHDVLYNLPYAPYYIACYMILLEAGFLVRMLRGDKPAFNSAALTVLAFLTSGVIEFTAIFQIAAGILTVCWLIGIGKKRKAALLCLPLISALVGLGIDLLGPGSIQRFQGGRLGLIPTIKGALVYCPAGIADALLSPLKYVLLLFLPDAVSFIKPPHMGYEAARERLRVWHALVLTMIGVFCFYAINVYAERQGLAYRGQFLTQWLMWFCWILYFLYFCNSRTILDKIAGSSLYKWRYCFVVLCVLLSFNTRDVVVSAIGAKTFRDEAEAQRSILLSAPRGGIAYIPYLDEYNKFLSNQYFMQFYPDYNQYMGLAKYYGVSEIRAAPREFLRERPNTQPSPEYYINMFKNMAQNSDVTAMTTLGRIYDVGLLGFPPDHEKAKYYYTLAADQGSVASAKSLLRLLLEDKSRLDYLQIVEYGLKYLINTYIWRETSDTRAYPA